jgi:tetraacyldisaccharide 4'-kinase
MRAPEFWDRRDGGLAAAVLAPVGRLYGLAVQARFALARPERAGVPVLCAGNLVAGGAGKTPVALSLGARLQGLGVAVHFLLRGYGGTAAGPWSVDPDRDTAKKVGDEALLLARVAPTWIAADRVAGARAAVAAGACALVMDDGFQNPSLVKDVSLIVVDGAYGFGNGRVMPAGPLREPLARGLARADAVVIVGEDRPEARARIVAAGFAALPVLGARLVPGPEAQALAGRKVVAFAGIGRPAKFFATLRGIGAEVVAVHAFPDHHGFSPRELEHLKREAHNADAVLVTTAKDAVRLPEPMRKAIQVLTITLAWDDEAALDAVLKPIMTRLRC